MSEGKTPTIEQKSTFSSKTKEGSDVEFVATIKFYINPAGDVKISTPGDGGGSNTPSQGSVENTITNEKKTEEVRVEVEKKETIERTQVSENDTKPSKGKEGVIKRETPLTPDKEEKGTSQNQGDCAINQFIPDPCKAIEDLTKVFTGFFSQNCPPCPRETSGYPSTLKGKLLVAEKEPGDEVLENEQNYEV